MGLVPDRLEEGPGLLLARLLKELIGGHAHLAFALVIHTFGA